MRVCLDARVDISSGGVQQFVMGLAHGLSRLDDGDEEYFFLTNKGEDDWLRPFVSGTCRIISSERPFEANLKVRAKAALPRVASLANRFRKPKLRSSDGLIERTGIDVMHFTHQNAFLTDIPSIYQPHDLQHLHHPEFFSPDQLRFRELTYETHCKRAASVVVMTSWGKQDLMHHYRLHEESVQVIPPAPLLPIYGNVSANHDAQVRNQLSLPEHFIFYPAQTWPHKNHLALLDALAILRDDHSLTVPLVCSGKLNDFYPVIRKRVFTLRLADQAQFIGFVSPATMVSLYRMSTALIFPSKFEGWGLPVCEAFFAGTPVACSDVTSLPDLAGNAALLFQPNDPREIAAAIHRLWQDGDLRKQLVEEGRKRAGDFSWEKTARMFRALYRKVAGRPLSDSEMSLLRQAPVV